MLPLETDRLSHWHDCIIFVKSTWWLGKHTGILHIFVSNNPQMFDVDFIFSNRIVIIRIHELWLLLSRHWCYWSAKKRSGKPKSISKVSHTGKHGRIQKCERGRPRYVPGAKVYVRIGKRFFLMIISFSFHYFFAIKEGGAMPNKYKEACYYKPCCTPASWQNISAGNRKFQQFVQRCVRSLSSLVTEILWTSIHLENWSSLQVNDASRRRIISCESRRIYGGSYHYSLP